MPYDSQITRSDITPLIPEDVIADIVQNAPAQSAVLSVARRLPNMARAQQRMPVLSALPTAYFVTGDTGLKQTAEMAWENKYVDAEEIACIVPIPESVLEDSDYDIWAEVRPRIDEAIGVVIDAAIIHGTNAPASWPDDIVTAATAAGNVVALGTGADVYDDILGENGTLATVEADGYNVTGHVAAMLMRARLRGLRDANGRPIWNMTPAEGGTRYDLEGVPMTFPRNGGINAAAALLVSGDFDQVMYAVRKDMTFKLLDQAVIQDGAGNIIYNLAQQDMVALRCVFRMGWQVPNPINRLQQTAADRYPLAVLTP
jgi:HK97 family phage major capsid protein